MKYFMWLTPLAAVITLGSFTQAVAADPAIAGIVRRLDRLEKENQELRERNARLENPVNEPINRIPSPEVVDGLPLGNYHNANYDYSADSPADQADPGAAFAPSNVYPDGGTIVSVATSAQDRATSWIMTTAPSVLVVIAAGVMSTPVLTLDVPTA